jgi:hypothetical protein
MLQRYNRIRILSVLNRIAPTSRLWANIMFQ